MILYINKNFDLIHPKKWTMKVPKIEGFQFLWSPSNSEPFLGVLAMAAPFFSTPFQPYVYQVLFSFTLLAISNLLLFYNFHFGSVWRVGKLWNWKKIDFYVGYDHFSCLHFFPLTWTRNREFDSHIVVWISFYFLGFNLV